MNVAEVIKLMALAPKGVFTIPDIHDEPAFRSWVKGVLNFAQMVTKLTTTLVDDDVAQLIVSIVEEDKTWAAVYKVILDVVPNKGPIVGAIPGWDWTKLLPLIQAIIDFINSLKK